MVTIASLWLPIVLSAVAVFVASSIIHMFLGYHQNDYRALPDEAGIMEAFRSFDVPAGDFVMPCPPDSKAMKDPEFQKKVAEGPVAFMTVLPAGGWGMGKSLVQWFLYSVVVGVFAAYVAGRALGPEADGLPVFRFVGVTAFVGYALALSQLSIWYHRSWTSTLKTTFDGLIYAVLTAGIFASMWSWAAG